MSTKNKKSATNAAKTAKTEEEKKAMKRARDARYRARKAARKAADEKYGATRKAQKDTAKKPPRDLTAARIGEMLGDAVRIVSEACTNYLNVVDKVRNIIKSRKSK